MPTYSYRCTKCGHKYEKFQKISDTVRPRCPECKGKGEREITGGAGVHFHGSGFYITDYGKSGSGSGQKTSEQKPETGKSDSKPSSSKGDDS